MSWTYETITHYPLASYGYPPLLWSISLTPQIDGKPFSNSRWTRLEGILPALENTYADAAGSIRLEAIGGSTAALIRVEVVNSDSSPHQFALRCDSVTNWAENPGWVDPTQSPGDNLVAGWNERADRVLILGVGADAYSLQPDGRALGPKGVVLAWNLKPGEKREGWVVRPYRAYAADLPALRKQDWPQEMEQRKKEWRDLLGRAAKLSIPDVGVSNAYLACLGDLFIMREPLADGYVGAICGTEVYRANNPIEAGIVAVALDQNGLHEDAYRGYKVAWDMQEPNGDWCDPKAWNHLFWSAPGFKAWAAMEHYRLTRDKKFLTEIYPRMAASSRWQEKLRARTRTPGGERPLTYGLMPRGFADCGLNDDGDIYGVFLPHNIWSVYADRLSVEAAEILGRTEDLDELKKIYETARTDLLTAVERGAIREKDYRWIPGVAGKACGSRWGALNIAFPCGLLPPDHELVTGTLQKIESNMGHGGLPLNMCFMADGVWAACALDNVAEVHLARGDGDAAAKYLYPMFNHGTPLYTWTEERGQDPGATTFSGDHQHLWSPVAVVRFMRDMLVMEDGDGLNLALGTARQWLASGKPVGIASAPTHFGPISYQMQYDADRSCVTGEVSFADDSTAAWSDLHIRLPGGLRVKAVNPESRATVLPDGSGIRWTAPRGHLKFQTTIGP
jgi:hypothetical protein